MKLQYLYSASVIIDTGRFRILCDPWFTEGAYYGSWWHYPPVEFSPIDAIGSVDLIWISHLHPDHYDPVFLKFYLERFPDTPLIAGGDFLHKMMVRDGFNPVSSIEPPPGIQGTYREKHRFI